MAEPDPGKVIKTSPELYPVKSSQHRCITQVLVSPLLISPNTHRERADSYRVFFSPVRFSWRGVRVEFLFRRRDAGLGGEMPEQTFVCTSKIACSGTRVAVYGGVCGACLTEAL